MPHRVGAIAGGLARGLETGVGIRQRGEVLGQRARAAENTARSRRQQVATQQAQLGLAQSREQRQQQQFDIQQPANRIRASIPFLALGDIPSFLTTINQGVPVENQITDATVPDPNGMFTLTSGGQTRQVSFADLADIAIPGFSRGRVAPGGFTPAQEQVNIQRNISNLNAQLRTAKDQLKLQSGAEKATTQVQIRQLERDRDQLQERSLTAVGITPEARALTRRGIETEVLDESINKQERKLSRTIEDSGRFISRKERENIRRQEDILDELEQRKRGLEPPQPAAPILAQVPLGITGGQIEPPGPIAPTGGQLATALPPGIAPPGITAIPGPPLPDISAPGATGLNLLDIDRSGTVESGEREIAIQRMQEILRRFEAAPPEVKEANKNDPKLIWAQQVKTLVTKEMGASAERSMR